jgi:hypothetical protein
MVGEKARSVYKKKRKGKPFSGRRKQEGKSEEPASVVDEIACSTAQLQALLKMKISFQTRTLKKLLVPPGKK